jgi:hypothetical protein
LTKNNKKDRLALARRRVLVTNGLTVRMKNNKKDCLALARRRVLGTNGLTVRMLVNNNSHGCEENLFRFQNGTKPKHWSPKVICLLFS